MSPGFPCALHGKPKPKWVDLIGIDPDAQLLRDPIEWERLDEGPTESAQMVEWHAPNTAQVLISKGWDECVEAFAWALKNGHPDSAVAYVAKHNPYADQTTTSADRGATSEGERA